MDVPRPGVESELQPLAYTTATFVDIHTLKELLKTQILGVSTVQN